MTTTGDLLKLVTAALTDSTDAQDRVWAPGDWPAQIDQFPYWKLRVVSEVRTSLGKGGPSQFSTTATIRLFGAVSEPAQVDNLGAADAEIALWALKGQGDAAVVNSYPLSDKIEQIAAMRSNFAYTSEAATHLAGVVIDIDLQFYEGPEDFAQPETTDLAEVHLELTGFPPVGFSRTFPA